MEALIPLLVLGSVATAAASLPPSGTRIGTMTVELGPAVHLTDAQMGEFERNVTRKLARMRARCEAAGVPKERC